MKGFVITCVLKPFNSTWRVDGVASTIIGILMHDENHFAMVGMEEGSTGNNVQSGEFMVVNASDGDSSTSPFQNSHIRSSKATIGSPINKRPTVRRRVFRHMVDVGFIDRVRGRIGIHDVLKGGVIKGEGFTGFSVDTIPTRNGRELGEIWVSKVGTNF